MLKKVYINLFLFFLFCLILLNGCRTSEPTMPDYNPSVSDTLKIQVQDSTLNSIKIRLISSSKEPGTRKVKLYRMRDDTTSLGMLLTEYSLSNKDTIFLDNNSGSGLLMGKDYKYRAMIVDTVKSKEYLRQEVTARTLSLTGDDYSWTEFSFGDFQSDLQAVWAANENDVYALGTIVRQGKVYGGMHYNGSSWELIKGAGGVSVFGFSSNDVWAAGGFLFHCDGTKWNSYGFKVVGDHVEILDTVLLTHGEYLAIWGTSGNNLYLGDAGGYIVHWDGSKAHLEDVKSSLPFRDIWGNSASDIYAVSGEIDSKQGELYHFDGSKWGLIKKGAYNPMSGELIGHFNSVWSYNEEELIVAGSVVARNVNNRWTQEGIGFYVERLRGDKPNNLFACGHRGSIAHYNGKNWTMLQAGTNTSTLLRGLFVKDDYVYVAGFDGYKAYIYHGKRKK